eukprot:366101-Chlamydomonas_euryale.AAC.12
MRNVGCGTADGVREMEPSVVGECAWRGGRPGACDLGCPTPIAPHPWPHCTHTSQIWHPHAATSAHGHMEPTP